MLNVPLDRMTIPEKLQLMETLWDDLSRNAEDVASPEWHGSVLQDREARIESGDAKFVDWEQAKADIRNRVS